MDGSESEQEEFVTDSLANWEPVQILYNVSTSATQEMCVFGHQTTYKRFLRHFSPYISQVGLLHLL